MTVDLVSLRVLVYEDGLHLVRALIIRRILCLYFTFALTTTVLQAVSCGDLRGVVRALELDRAHCAQADGLHVQLVGSLPLGQPSRLRALMRRIHIVLGCFLLSRRCDPVVLVRADGLGGRASNGRR